MPQTALATRGAAADAATADDAATPIALAPAAALPRREEAGRVALFRQRGSVWNAAAERHRLPLAWISFLLVVVLPVAIAAAYYFLVAADQYVAEFRFGLRSAEPVRADPGALLQQGAAPLQIGLDSYAVVQYIASRAIVDDLGKTLDLRRMFSTPAADWPARLHLPVPIEELVAYWRGQVDAFFDATNGTIMVRARAFTAHDALALAQGILASSERLVNGLSARARRDTLRNSEQEVQEAERRLTAALARLRDYRDREGLIDPHKAADANAALAGRLRDELVRAGTDLSTLKQYMQGDAPALKILEARIETLEAQRSTVESEATDTETTPNRALSRMMGSYEELEGERHFAETAYQHALEALDRARIDADRQQIYVADFVRPSLPEEALYPRRLRSLGVVFVIAFAIWAIGSLTMRSVRDHLL
jgi:capsular polysaccharide transport system permease protein